jgi:SAM-dependent methyltransferase
VTANDTARADWNGVSGQAWVAEADRRDESLAAVLDVLVSRAGLSAGERVLDIGCGCGATTLAAAREVGADGAALGVDISEPMLDVARRRAGDAGLSQVSFVAGDAQTDELRGPHEIAISRFGTMFFDDPAAAFANVRRSLRSGGRLCIATWQPMSDNDWLVTPGAALLPYGNLPTVEAGAPGMFAQSSSDTIVEALEPAGFGSIDVDAVQVQLRLGGDAAEATDYFATVGLVRAILEPLDPSDRAAALAAVTDTFAERADADGVTFAGGILVTTATR